MSLYMYMFIVSEYSDIWKSSKEETFKSLLYSLLFVWAGENEF